MAESKDSNGKRLDFDPVALREKYREEREKRMDAAGSRKYVKLQGQLGRLYEDPNADPNFTRDPVIKEMDFAIIGGGYGGLLCGAELRRVGVERICIIERGSDIGGTWYLRRPPFGPALERRVLARGKALTCGNPVSRRNRSSRSWPSRSAD